MITVDLLENNETLYLPSTLAECDRQQARDVCRVFYQYAAGEISMEELRLSMLYAVLNLRTVPMDQEQQHEVDENLSLLSFELGSFFDNVDGKLQIKTDFIDNPFTWLRTGWFKMYGPVEQCENITFGQYVAAVNSFADYADTGDESYLDQLLAIMFLPRFTLSRKLKPFNPTAINKRAAQFKHLDIGYKFGFYLYFASFQQYLRTAKIYWEGNEIDLSILFNSQPGEETAGESKYPGLGMLSLKLDMAQSGVFGTADDVDRKRLWDVLPHMYKIRKADLDRQQAAKDAK